MKRFTLCGGDLQQLAPLDRHSEKPLVARRSGAAFVLAVLLFAGAAGNAGATDYYWDINQGGAGAGGYAPSGAWNGTAQNWNNTSSGGAGTYVADPGTANWSFFSAGTDAGGAYTITVTGTRSTGLLQFNRGDVTLTGGTGINLNGNIKQNSLTSLVTIDTPIALQTGCSIDVYAGGLRIGGQISGAQTLAKTSTGSGKLILSGNNNYSGATTISGVLNVRHNSALGTTAGNTTVNTGGALQIEGSGLVVAEPLVLWSTGIASDGTLRNISGDNEYSGTIALNSTPRINSDSGTLTLSGVISGGTSLSIGGLGTVKMAMAIANTFSSTTTVDSGGTLTLAYPANISMLHDSSALVFAGGTVNLAGTVTHTELVSAGTVNAGASAITRSAGSSTLRLNTITRNVGGTLNLGAASLADCDNNNVNSILGGWATVGGSDWAKTVASGAADTAITALSTYDGSLPASGGLSSANYLQTGTHSGLTGGVVANSLKIANSGTSEETLPLGGNNLTLTYSSATSLGGLLYVGGGGDLYTISGSGGKLIMSSTTGELIMNIKTGTLTVSAPIVASGATAGILTKTGAGKLVVNVANTFTGATYVNQGVLNLQNATASGSTAGGISVATGAALQLEHATGITIGAEALTLNGMGVNNDGALRNVSGANTYNGAITLGSQSRINSDTVAVTLTLGASDVVTASGYDLTVGGQGNITFNGNIKLGTGGGLIKDGSGTVTVGSNNNTGTGAITVNDGTLVFGNFGFNAVTRILLNGGSFQLGGSNKFNDCPLLINGGTLAMGTFSEGLTTVILKSGSISGSGTLTGTGYWVESGSISPILAGSVTLTKGTTGTVTLSGACSYTGATTISAGALIVDGSLASGSAVTVQNGGTLGGNGTISGTVTVDNGGTIQPSLSGAVNTLKLASTTAPTFSAYGTLKIRVPTSGTADRVSLTSTTPAFACGNLDLVIDTTGLSGSATGLTIVQVAKTSGGISGTFRNVSANNGYTATVNYNGTTGPITVDLSPPGAATATTLARTAGSSPSTYGASVTFQATVTSGGSPVTSGTVTFKDGATTLASGVALDGSGHAEFTTSTLSYNGGSAHSLAAYYIHSGAYLDSDSSASPVSHGVNRKGLTITGVTASDRPYNGGTGASLSGGTLEGVVGTESVTISAGTGTFGSKDIGSQTVTASGYSIGGADVANYELSAQPTVPNATITAVELTITGVTASDRPYNGGTGAALSGGTLVGVVGTEDVQIVAGAGTFASKNIGSRAVTASGYGLTGTDAGNYTLPAQPTVPNATITAVGLTITGVTASGRPYDGTTAASLSGGSLVGVVGTEDVQISAGTGTFGSRNAGSQSVTASGYGLTGTDAGNYTLSAQPTVANATITTRSITVTAVTDTKPHDGNTTSIGVPTITSGSLGSGDTATWSQTFDTADAGTGKTLTPSGSVTDGNGGLNYDVTFVANHTGVITASSTPTTTSVSLTDGSDPSTYGSSVTFQATVLDDTLAPVQVGTVTFKDGGSTVASGVTLDGNGHAEFTTSTLSYNGGSAHSITAYYFASGVYASSDSSASPVSHSVNRKGLTITGVTASDRPYNGGTDADLSGGTLVGVVGTEDVTINAGTGTFGSKDIGSQTVTASGYSIGGADVANYDLSAQPTVPNATITAVGLTITGVTASDKPYDGNDSAALSGGTLVGVVGTEDVQIVAGAGTFASKDIGSHAVTASGYGLSGTDAGNYTLSAQPTVPNATITALGLTITGVTASGKTYDGTTTASLSGGSLVGVIGMEDVQLVAGTGTFGSRNVGSETVTASGYGLTGTDAGNYVLSAQPTVANATITTRPITVTATTDSKAFDGTTSSTALPTITSGSLGSGDTATWSQTFDTAAVGTGKTLTATGSVTDGNGGLNYVVNFVTVSTGSIISLPAGTYMWDGGSTVDSAWNTAANWVGDSTPPSANTTTVIFSGGVRTSPVQNSAVTVNAIQFGPAASAFTVSGSGVITVGGTSPSVMQDSSANQDLSGMSSGVKFNSSSDVFISGTGSGILSMGYIDKTGSTPSNVRKQGAFTLILKDAGSNIQNFPLWTVEDGVLELNRSSGTCIPNALTIGESTDAHDALVKYTGSSSSMIASGKNLTLYKRGTLDLNGYSATLGGTIAMYGGAIQTGAGTLTLNGNVTYNALSGAEGAATITGNLSLGSATRTFTVADSSLFANDLAISAVISQSSGSQGITKEGAGTLALSGVNTFTGATTINAGVLKLTSGSLANTTVTLNNGASSTFAVKPGAATAISLGNTATSGAGGSVYLNSSTIFDMTDGALSTFSIEQNASCTTKGLSVDQGLLKFDLTESGADLLDINRGAGGGAVDVVYNRTYTVDIDTSAAASLSDGGSYTLISAASGLDGGTVQFPGGGTTKTVGVSGTNYRLTLSKTATAVKVDVTQLVADTTPPDWAPTWPSLSAATAVGFTVNAQINEAGTAYYVVLASGATAPDAAHVRLLQDATGGAPLASGTIALTANTAATAVLTSLQPSTPYDVYIVAEDQAVPANQGTLAGPLSMTTLAVQDVYWDINGTGTAGPGTLTGNLYWDTSAYWNPDPLGGNGGGVAITTPGSANRGVFSAGTTGTGAFTVNATSTDKNAAGLLFEEGQVTLSASTVSINLYGDVTQNSPSAVTISAPLVLHGASRTFTVGAGGLSISDGKTVTGSANLVIDNGGTVTVDGDLTTTGDLTKRGSGTLSLTGSGANTYTGTTTVEAGTLTMAGQNSLGGTSVGTVVQDGGALELAFFTGPVVSEPLTLTGSGPSGGGAVVCTSGSTTRLGGLITLAGANPVRINSGVVTLTIQGGVTGSGKALVLGGTGSITVQTAAIATDTGTLTKDGVGTLNLNVANSYTGLTDVQAGTLLYGVNNAIASGDVQVSGGTLDIVGFTDSVGGLVLTSGIITGAAGVLTVGGSGIDVRSGTVDAILGGAVALTKSTGGLVTLSRANTYSGGTTVGAGTLKVSNTTGSATGTGAVTVQNAGTLTGTGAVSGAVTVQSGGTIVPGNDGVVGTLTVGGLALQSGCAAVFEFASASSYDQILSSGSMTCTGGGVYLYQMGTATPFATEGAYPLMQYTGTAPNVTGLHVLNPNASVRYGFAAEAGWVTLHIRNPGTVFQFR